MTIKEFKQYGIQKEKIDNGYRVSPTYRYKAIGEYIKTDLVIDIDKTDNWGKQIYVMTINDELVKNFRGSMLYWEKLDEAEKDLFDMFMGCFPKRCFNTIL